MTVGIIGGVGDPFLILIVRIESGHVIDVDAVESEPTDGFADDDGAEAVADEVDGDGFCWA